MTRWDGARQWLQLVGVFPILLGAWFLVTDPVRGLLADTDAAAGGAAEVDRPGRPSSSSSSTSSRWRRCSTRTT